MFSPADPRSAADPFFASPPPSQEVLLGGMSQREQLEAQHEAKVLRELDHPNIIRCVPAQDTTTSTTAIPSAQALARSPPGLCASPAPR